MPTPQSTKPELVGLPYSPWSEKARWALDLRRVPYTSTTYAPMIGEVGLRRRMGKWTGQVSVPVLFDDHGAAIADSHAIARWADTRGEGASLFPSDLEAEVARFVALSERAMAAGRCLSLERMLADDEALREMVPKPMRRSPLATAIAAFGVRRTLRKYDAARGGAGGEKHEAVLTASLDELRSALASQPAPADASQPKTLLGRFTFADIAMTQTLGFIEPPSFGLRIGKASRRSFTHPILRERYADLIAWRNAIYEARRPRD
jgi:glutathione S-transferase